MAFSRLVLGALLFAGCSGAPHAVPPAPTGTLFAEDTTYSRDIPGCDAAPPANCTQYMTLGADGSAFVLLTDEGNAGTYALDALTLHISFTTTQGDGGEAMTFSLSCDETSATNADDDQVWLRK